MASKSMLLVVLAAALSTSAFAQTPQGQSGSSGAPTVLKYRDPSTPLTIGEMSALQAEKAEADFFKKFGYTVTAPPPAGPTPQEQAMRAAAARPGGVITALSIYGPADAPVADITLNGVLVSVRGGERLAGGLAIQSVRPQGLTLTLPSKKKKGATLTYSLGVGDMLEFPL